MKYFGLNDRLALIRWMYRNEISEFEKEFAQYTGIRYAIACGYGRTALYLGLKSTNLEGKEIIVPNFLCTVVRHAVVMAGVIPTFVDVEPDHLGYDLRDLQKKITANTKALIITHYFGNPAKNMDDVLEIATAHKLLIIEDCAHSLGAVHNGKQVGTFGDFSIFSLTKGMVNCGGGVLATDNEELYRKARTVSEKLRANFKKRIADFPIMLGVGIDQYLTKVYYNNSRRRISRWIVIHSYKALLKVRALVLKLARMALPDVIDSKKGSGENESGNRLATASCDETRLGEEKNYIETQAVYMEPIIASIGRVQLKKYPRLLEAKERIWETLRVGVGGLVDENQGGKRQKGVRTYLVLRAEGMTIDDLSKKMNGKGVEFKKTWPSIQALWTGQDSGNLKRLRNQTVTWEINPGIKEQELRRFIEIMKECNNSGSASVNIWGIAKR